MCRWRSRLLKCTERLRVLGRGRVHTRSTEVKCSYKPSMSLLSSLVGNYCVRVK